MHWPVSGLGMLIIADSLCWENDSTDTNETIN